MARVNFSVPANTKKLNRAFVGNESQIIADLMTQAVEEQVVLKRRSEVIAALPRRHRIKRLVAANETCRARGRDRS